MRRSYTAWLFASVGLMVFDFVAVCFEWRVHHHPTVLMVVDGILACLFAGLALAYHRRLAELVIEEDRAKKEATPHG